jgi:hypothetical protein
MRLSIDDLRVDSYATQVSELELTEVKGGTTPWCVYVGCALIAAGTAIIVAAVNSKPHDSTTTTVHYDSHGKMVDSTVVKIKH